MRMRLISVKEAAAKIDGLTEYMIRRMIKDNRVPCVSSGGKILVSEGEIIKAAFGAESAEYKFYTNDIMKD